MTTEMVSKYGLTKGFIDKFMNLIMGNLQGTFPNYSVPAFDGTLYPVDADKHLVKLVDLIPEIEQKQDLPLEPFISRQERKNGLAELLEGYERLYVEQMGSLLFVTNRKGGFGFISHHQEQIITWVMKHNGTLGEKLEAKYQNHLLNAPLIKKRED